MRTGLVLGAGGVVGMSYHAGVLHALAEVGGIDPAASDLIIGTSAGSVMGALLRSGWSSTDCWQFALEEHPVVAEVDEAERERRRRATFAPQLGSPSAMARRAIGSTYVAARSMVKAPVPRIPRMIAKQFPAGLFSSTEMQDRLAEVLPEQWPADDLYLVAVDVTTGKRVVFGREGSPYTSLRRAVQASCAIPAVYPPVKIGSHLYVDGGAHSSTHLDLAAKAGCDRIIGIVPMGFDPRKAPGTASRMIRRMPTRAASREARTARAMGADVVLISPCAEELRIHGRDMMRPADTGAIARAAYECTARMLDTPRFRRNLAA